MAQRRLNILIGARDRASRVLRAIGSAASRLGRRFAFVGAAAAAAAAVGFTLLIRSQLKAIDATAKMADTLGLTTTQLVGFQRAAVLTGVPVEGMSKGIARMQKNIADATDGLSTVVRAFDKLGLSAEELIKLDTAEQFKLIGDGLTALEEPATRAQIALQLFGRAGLAITKLTALGSERLARFESEAIKLGAAFNRIDAARIELANDAISDMQLAFIGIARTFAIAVAPAIEAFAKVVTNVVAGISRAMRDSMATVQELAVRAFTIAEFAAKNWRSAVELAVVNVQLKIVEFQDDVAIDIAAAFEIAVFKSKQILARFRVFWDGFIGDFFMVRQNIIDQFAGTLAGFVLKFKKGIGQITEDEFQAALKALPGQLEGIEMLRAAQRAESAASRVKAQLELNKVLQENEKEHVRRLAAIAETGDSKRAQDLRKKAESLRSTTLGLEFQETLGRRLAALGEAPELGLLARAALGLDEDGLAAPGVTPGGPAARGAAAVTGRFLTGVQAARREEDRSLTELQELNEKQREANRIADRSLLVLEGLSTSVLRGEPLAGSGLEALA